MNISSTAFPMHGSIPALYTCDGENIHPPLEFADVPKNAQSLVLTMEDPDVPKHLRPDGMWDHWVIWNIPPTVDSISPDIEIPGVYGRNTGGNNSYQGPCPPDREHRYFFRVFALDTILDLPIGSSKNDVLTAIRGHTIDEAVLMGRYARPSMH